MLQIARAVTALAVAPILLGASTASTGGTGASDELTAAKAAVLGLVEGVTEYLPVSSTGHLLVTQDLLGIGETDATEDAADTYAITIQAGAILAVVVLYLGRIRSMAAGVAGRDPAGRHVLTALGVAFVPAAAVAVAFEATIKDSLFGTGPVIAAWAVGGAVILGAARWLRGRPPGTVELEHLPLTGALAVGIAQVAALWPGTSRSLVTILAGLVLGLRVHAALEFSFLLGLVTLGAATGYEAVRNGSELFDIYGTAEIALGFAVAFGAAVVSVRWLVAYLGRHGLELFGWYRIAIAAVAAVLVATGTI